MHNLCTVLEMATFWSMKAEVILVAQRYGEVSWMSVITKRRFTGYARIAV